MRVDGKGKVRKKDTNYRTHLQTLGAFLLLYNIHVFSIYLLNLCTPIENITPMRIKEFENKQGPTINHYRNTAE